MSFLSTTRLCSSGFLTMSRWRCSISLYFEVKSNFFSFLECSPQTSSPFSPPSSLSHFCASHALRQKVHLPFPWVEISNGQLVPAYFQLFITVELGGEPILPSFFQFALHNRWGLFWWLWARLGEEYIRLQIFIDDFELNNFFLEIDKLFLKLFSLLFCLLNFPFHCAVEALPFFLP